MEQLLKNYQFNAQPKSSCVCCDSNMLWNEVKMTKTVVWSHTMQYVFRSKENSKMSNSWHHRPVTKICHCGDGYKLYKGGGGRGWAQQSRWEAGWAASWLRQICAGFRASLFVWRELWFNRSDLWRWSTHGKMPPGTWSKNKALKSSWRAKLLLGRHANRERGEAIGWSHNAFQVIWGGCAVSGSSNIEWPEQGDLNKSSFGSIHQKYVYTCFMVKMRIKSGSLGLFKFYLGWGSWGRKCEVWIFQFFKSKRSNLKGWKFETCLDKLVCISESTSIWCKKYVDAVYFMGV